MVRRAIAWLRNDLRLRDNEIFHGEAVRNAAELLVVYCIDPRHYERSSWGDHRRCGVHRSQLTAESLEALDQSLEKIGSKLHLALGQPEEVLPRLLAPGSVLLYQAEDTHDEQQVEEAVRAALPHGVDVRCHFGQTLRHRDDLGFDLKEWLPLPFGKFYHETCNQVHPRRELRAPGHGELPPVPKIDANAAEILAVRPETSSILEAMGFKERAESTGDFHWKGGEDQALEQLESYCSKSGLGCYQQTRNQLHVQCTSRLSPWMAIGCLSPRTVFWRAERFERENGKDQDRRFDHVQKFIFQLCWRDYFRFYCAHFGRMVFFPSGPARRWRPWKRNAEVEQRWKEGRTGVPLVDALMRELSETGFMANRGRYIVASYLVFYLNIDWRVGADWFESLLLDHDVCSNYGEWASMANVAVDLGEKYPLGLKGRGPTGGRKPGAKGGGGDPWAKGVDLGDAIFDPFEQARHYDRDESYVRRWLPELSALPAGSIHTGGAVKSYLPPLATEAAKLGRRKLRQQKVAEKWKADTREHCHIAAAGYPTKRADQSDRPQRRWQAKASRLIGA